MAFIVFKTARERQRKGKLARWTYKFHGVDGNGKHRLGYTDKARTIERAKKAEWDATKLVCGMVDPREERLSAELRRSLAAHRDEYRDALKAQNRNERHVAATIGYITRVAEALEWRTLCYFRSRRLESHLAGHPPAHRGRVAQLARAPARHAGGQRFTSSIAHHSSPALQARPGGPEASHLCPARLPSPETSSSRPARTPARLRFLRGSRRCVAFKSSIAHHRIPARVPDFGPTTQLRAGGQRGSSSP